MKVLHLPVNYGSVPSHTVRLLRGAGLDARGLFFSTASIQPFAGQRFIGTGAKAPLRRLASRVRWALAFVRTLVMLRPDLVHWYFGKAALPFGLDLALLRSLRIPGLVEWQGSDIRIPEVEFADNPYYRPAFENGYEYRHLESRETSRRRQARFARAGFRCAVPVGMLQYVQKDIFPKPYLVPQRLVLADYDPAYPDPAGTRPLVVHVPTAPVAKGTAAVLKAVEQLKEACEFEFELLRGLPHDEAIRRMRRADVVIDQLGLGDRGMVSLEAMALGKPVLCYVKPALAALYPAEMPIVNATPDSLADLLGELIGNPVRRSELGQRGRTFMEQYFQPEALVAALQDIYYSVLAKGLGHGPQG
jgi:hypothetical protein